MIEAGEKTIFPIRTRLYFLVNEINKNEELYIASAKQLNDVKYDGKTINIVSTMQGDVDPNTDYISLLIRSADEGCSCKPGDKTRFLIKGGELMHVNDLEFEEEDQKSALGNYYIFDYLKETKLLIKNDGKSITLQPTCIKKEEIIEETPKSKSVSISKKMLIIVCIVICVVVIAAVEIVVCIIKKKKQRRNTSSIEAVENIENTNVDNTSEEKQNEEEKPFSFNYLLQKIFK